MKWSWAWQLFSQFGFLGCVRKEDWVAVIELGVNYHKVGLGYLDYGNLIATVWRYSKSDYGFWIMVILNTIVWIYSKSYYGI